MQLQEAIDLLSSLRRDAGIFKRDRHVAALSLAIDSLEVQALVGPARASDPATSHRAAPSELRAGSQRARLLAAFHSHGMGTSVQACEWADIDPFRGSPWKRVSELKAAGFIEVAGISVGLGCRAGWGEGVGQAATHERRRMGELVCTQQAGDYGGRRRGEPV